MAKEIFFGETMTKENWMHTINESNEHTLTGIEIWCNSMQLTIVCEREVKKKKCKSEIVKNWGLKKILFKGWD